MKTESSDLLYLIKRALAEQFDGNKLINDVSIDGTNDDCEMIITMDDGTRLSDWVIKAVEVDRGNNG